MKATLVRVLFAILAISGVSSFAESETDTSVAVDSAYRIGPEDVLDISVWKEEGLNKTVLVRPDGSFSYPLVGDVRAGGRTVEEIRQELTEKLRTYVNAPAVTVSISKIRGKKIYVIGQVTKPGEYVVGRNIQVMQVLSMAGGLTTFASGSNIKILRNIDGKRTSISFNFDEVVKGRKLEQDIFLQDGDVVTVP